MQKITFSIFWPYKAADFRELLSFTFKVSFVSYFGFFLVDSLQSGFISNFFNNDFFLWSSICTGLLTLIWPQVVVVARNSTRPRWKTYAWMVMLAIVTIGIVWHSTFSIGQLVYIIAPLSGLIVFGLCFLVYFDTDE